ncbi:cytochrome c [Bradyrhizobium sp. Tv2a-2]|uniref:c-type cytochrome n=1 Tax=Bradyrhizobium sp. Tv2a-2 TaxID=113395 RepID=UPI0004015477|nr:cytochrome c [Bradyrhizobium sp. Tv2a-2]
MRRRFRGSLAVTALLLTTASSFAGDTDPQAFTQIERGRYLTILSDCASCHTVPDSSQPFAGGRPIETPFGNIVAPNITPDPETGVGSWSDEQFDAAVRKGIGRNGSRLYPAMPYNAYTKMSRDDVLAIRAYLNTVPPVGNAVIANTLPFPFNIRTAMRVWDALYFKEGDYRPDPKQSVEWNRGAYLVDGPGHCGACHTPKTFLGGDKTDQYLQGSYLQGWSAPDITNNSRLGLGGWSKEDLVSYLKSGHNRVTAATGPMGEVVTLSTAHMTDPDLNAIATYLKSLPGKTEQASPLSANEPTMAAGAAIYRDQCSACHGLDGKGVAELFPSIADSSMARSDDPTTSIRIILRGARSVGTSAQPTAPGMPSYGRQLDDNEVAAVLTYMRNSWGGAAGAVAADQVSKVRLDTALRPD